MVLTACFVLSPEIGLCVSVIPEKRELLKNLTPASRRQDHTTSPSADRSFVFCATGVHRIFRPTFVTIAKRPSCGQETRGEVPVICPTSQAKISATDWHD